MRNKAAGLSGEYLLAETHGVERLFATGRPLKS